MNESMADDKGSKQDTVVTTSHPVLLLPADGMVGGSGVQKIDAWCS
jgi:hypothetical protein